MDSYLRAIESELESWPGTGVDVVRRSKHRSVRLRYGRSQRSIIIPTSGSDHRGPKNAITQLRRTLIEMGATKLDKRPATKKQKKDAQTLARIGVNKSAVVFVVPRHSSLHSRFVENGKTKSYWSMELRSNADPKGVPYLAIVEKPAPIKGKMHPGVAGGFINKQTGAYSLAILRTQFKAMNKLGEFTSQAIDLYEDLGDVLMFKLPANRQPLSARGGHKDEPVAEGRIAPKPEPEVVLREEKIEEPAPVPAPAPSSQQPTPLVIQAPKEAVSLEKAINVINAYKRKMQSDLRLTISEGGFLSVVAKYGVR